MTKNERYRLVYDFESRHALPNVVRPAYWSAMMKDYESILDQHEDDVFLCEMLNAVVMGYEDECRKATAANNQSAICA